MFYVLAEVRDFSTQQYHLVRVGKNFINYERAERFARKYSVSRVIDYARGIRNPVFVKDCKHAECFFRGKPA